MTLYFYVTEYGALNIKEIIIEDVLKTITNNYKTKEGNFPFFNKNLISTELTEFVYQYTGALDGVSDNNRSGFSKVCFFYTEKQSKENAAAVFKTYYNAVLEDYENKIAEIEALLSETEEKYNKHFQELLEKAKIIASTAHYGQKDRGGRPYIEHPKAVASMVSDIKEKIVAYLHDVIEDTPVDAEFLLKEGFTREIVDAVLLLSRDINIEYEEYLKAIKRNSLARAVKIADLTHNSDLTRIPNPTDKDVKRKEKYLRAIKALEA